MLETKSESSVSLKTTFDIDFNSKPKGPRMPLLSNFDTSVYIFKGIVGSGVLGLAKSFGQVGFVMAAVCLLINALISLRVVQLTLEVADEVTIKKSKSLKNLADEVLGYWGRVSIGASILLTSFGSSLDYISFAVNNVGAFMCNMGLSESCSSQIPGLVFICCIILPMTLVKYFKSLWIPTTVASIMILFGIAVQIIYNLGVIFEEGNATTTFIKNLPVFGFEDLPDFFGQSLFAFNFYTVFFIVRENMEKPQQLNEIVYKDMVGVFLLYTIFPLTSFIAYESNIPSPIFNMLPTTTFYNFVRFLYAIALSVTCGFQSFIFLDLIERWDVLKHRIYNSDRTEVKGPILRFITRMAVMITTIYIGYAVENYSLYLYLPMNGTLTFASFLFPVILHQKVFAGKIPNSELVFNWGFAIFGVLVGLWTIVDFFHGLQ